jgi:hypothetical protein
MIDGYDEKVYLNRKVIKIQFTWAAPAAVAANAAVEQSAGTGSWLAGDMIFKIEKPTDQAGLSLISARVDAAGLLQVKWSNGTAGILTPTAAEIYQVLIAR